ncbi:MAG: helix-turn-helix domain-containing protein [Actinobacteria bacterium]|nr:helix-turn-helix domain-containing protein [Actinomycetota bacterium]
MDNSSGVGVVDKSVAILEAASEGPVSLGELVSLTGIPRPTAHRLAVALEFHDLLERDDDGRFRLGRRLLRWSGDIDPLLQAAQRAVNDLRDQTQVSAQVYRRQSDSRLCIAAAEPSAGLRDSVPVGAVLTMRAGSAAQVLTAWAEPDLIRKALRSAAFTAADLAATRDRGWAHSIAQREPGVASISAPIRDALGDVVAAISLSGPLDRLERPTRAHVAALLAAADRLGEDHA